MTVPKYDMMEGAVGVEIEQVLRDKAGSAVIIEGPVDKAKFRFWFDGDQAAVEKDAVIVDEPSNIVRYVTEAGDLKPGRMTGVFILTIPSKQFDGPIEPQTYMVGPANP